MTVIGQMRESRTWKALGDISVFHWILTILPSTIGAVSAALHGKAIEVVIFWFFGILAVAFVALHYGSLLWKRLFPVTVQKPVGHSIPTRWKLLIPACCFVLVLVVFIFRWPRGRSQSETTQDQTISSESSSLLPTDTTSTSVTTPPAPKKPKKTGQQQGTPSSPASVTPPSVTARDNGVAVGSITQSPGSMAQVVGGTGNVAIQQQLGAPEKIESMSVSYRMVCELRQGHKPPPLSDNIAWTTNVGVTLVGFPRQALLAPRGVMTSKQLENGTIEIDQTYAHDDFNSIIGSPVTDVLQINALDLNPSLPNDNWCSRIMASHLTMVMNQMTILDFDGQLPADGLTIPEDKPGQQNANAPITRLPVTFTAKAR